jgi:uncharacterized membrane protein
MSSEVKGLARLEMFSDGVFAIAITLLVLDLKVPPLKSITSIAGLWHELLIRWTYYFAFVFSFGNIFISWINHSATFNLLSKVTKPLIWANGFLLLTTIFIPYPTAILGEYIGTPYLQPAAVFFCASGTLVSVGWNMLILTMLYPSSLVKPNVNKKIVRRAVLSTRAGFFIYLVTTFIAWWFPVTALVINTSLLLFWITISTVDREV